MNKAGKVDPRTLTYRSNRAQLLCGWCGAPNCVKALCPDCSQKNRERIRKKYKANRAVGRCGYCGKKTKNAICKDCFLPHQRWMRRNKRKGLCYKCGREPVPGSTQCAQCLVGSRIVHKRLYRQRVKRGVCPYCEDTPAPGVLTCAKHRKWDHDRMNKQNRKKYKELKAEGTCVRCQQTKAMQNRVLCVGCRMYVNTTNLERYRKNK